MACLLHLPEAIRSLLSCATTDEAMLLGEKPKAAVMPGREALRLPEAWVVGTHEVRRAAPCCPLFSEWQAVGIPDAPFLRIVLTKSQTEALMPRRG